MFSNHRVVNGEAAGFQLLPVAPAANERLWYGIVEVVFWSASL
jgi:hypothetical protein